MPNELSEKVYPDGTVVKLRDDTARTDIATINSSLSAQTLTSTDYKATSSNFEYTGISYTCPIGKTAIVYGQTAYGHSRPIGLALSSSNSALIALCETTNVGSYVIRTPALMITGGETVYLWDKRYDTPVGTNPFYIKGIVIG